MRSSDGVILRIIAILLMLTVAAVARGQSVDLRMAQIGVGGAFRTGEMTGLQLELTSRLAEPTPAFVQWEVTNPDGDIAEYGRSVTLTPNLPTNVWLYAPLLPAPHVESSTVWTVRVLAQEDGEIGRELAVDRISPADVSHQLVPLRHSMIGVIGSSQPMGLDAYDVQNRMLDTPNGAHEYTRIVTGISPSNLPDRWEALGGFEAFVWSPGRDASPADLRVDPAAALREYVRRGGHLVITLPETGDAWAIGQPDANEFSDLLPGTAPRLDEDVPLADLLPILSKSQQVEGDVRMAIRVFGEANGSLDAMDNHYEPLLALPDGRIVGVQRQYGFGRITLIGIDVASPRLGGLRYRLPHADVLWNRVLGRRADAPTAREIRTLEDDDQLARGRLNRYTIELPGVILERLDMRRHAGIAVILSLFVFAVYWVIAGPGGFFLLRKLKLGHHAWVAFGLCALVFTIVAWGGVTAIRDQEVSVQHLTVIDHIARRPDDLRPGEPQYQRASSYFSVYMPRYGHTAVSLDSGTGQRNLLYAWQAPEESLNRFPNADRYRVDNRLEADELTVPSRSTTTNLHARWMGVVDQSWGSVSFRVDPDDPIREVADGAAARLAGTITHDMPSDLRDVQIFLVSSNRRTPPTFLQRDGREVPYVNRTRSGLMLNSAYAWAPGDGRTLQKGRTYDLAEITDTRDDARLNRFLDDQYLRPLEQSRRLTSLTTRDSRRSLEMQSFYHALPPPQYIGEQFEDGEVVAQRVMGRELDLSSWMNRPCVIIIGYLDNSDIPVPVRVDGAAQQSNGLTMVRWIYPLPVDPETIVPTAR